jgi:hypothetical protein
MPPILSSRFFNEAEALIARAIGGLHGDLPAGVQLSVEHLPDRFGDGDNLQPAVKDAFNLVESFNLQRNGVQRV